MNIVVRITKRAIEGVDLSILVFRFLSHGLCLEFLAMQYYKVIYLELGSFKSRNKDDLNTHLKDFSADISDPVFF